MPKNGPLFVSLHGKCARPIRMALTESFNAGAHGGIHQLLGGSWSQQVSAYAERTDPIVQPFVHVAVVREIPGVGNLLLSLWGQCCCCCWWLWWWWTFAAVAAVVTTVSGGIKWPLAGCMS